MAPATLLDINEYLSSSYRPDREYIDGELRERNVGKWDHARVQYLLAGWFLKHESLWGSLAARNSGCKSPQRGFAYLMLLCLRLKSRRTFC